MKWFLFFTIACITVSGALSGNNQTDLGIDVVNVSTPSTFNYGVYVPFYGANVAGSDPGDWSGGISRNFSGEYTTYAFANGGRRGQLKIEFDITPSTAGTAGFIAFSNYLALLQGSSAGSRLFEVELLGDGDIRLVGGTTGVRIPYTAGVQNHIKLNINTASETAFVTGTVHVGDMTPVSLGTINARTFRNQVSRLSVSEPYDDTYRGTPLQNIGSIGVLASAISYKIENFRIDGVYEGLGLAVDRQKPFVEGVGYEIVLPEDEGIRDVYHIGPNRNYKKIQDVLNKLKAGDTIFVDGDATYPGGIFFNTASGTADKPITLKGITVNGNKPKIKSLNAQHILFFNRSHYVLDNFDIEGSLQELLGIFTSVTAETIALTNPDNARTEVRARINYSAVYNRSAHLTVRYCSIHDARMGVFSSDDLSGDYVIEYNDIYRNGSQNGDHNLYITTDGARYPAAASVVRFNHIRNSVSGNGLKTRSAKHLVYYNVFEDNFHQSLELIGPDVNATSLLREMKAYNPDFHEFYVREDADVVGNLVIHRDAPYINTTMVRCGGDGTGHSYGRYRFVNNTFIMLNSRGSYRRIIRAEFGVESFEMYNNVFYAVAPEAVRIFADNDDTNPPQWASISGGTAAGQVGDQNRGSQWSSTWAGAAGVRVVGANNWVSAGSTQIPDGWTNTMYGDNPFVDLAGGDYRVAADADLLTGVPVDNANTVKQWEPWKSNLYGFNYVNDRQYRARGGVNAWFFEGETNRGVTVLDDGHFKGAPEMLNYEAINVNTFIPKPRHDGSKPTLGAYLTGTKRVTQPASCTYGVYVPFYGANVAGSDPGDWSGGVNRNFPGEYTTYSFVNGGRRGRFTIEFDITPSVAGTAGFIAFSNYMALLQRNSAGSGLFEVELMRDGDIRLVGGTTGVRVPYTAGVQNRVRLHINTASETECVSGTVQVGDNMPVNLGTINARTFRNNVSRLSVSEPYNDTYRGAPLQNLGSIGVLASAHNFKIENFRINDDYEGLHLAVDRQKPFVEGVGYEIVIPADEGIRDVYHVGQNCNYKKIQDVLYKLKAGDTIFVDGDATYPGGIFFNTASGTADKPITLKGITVDGNKPKIKSLNTRHILFFNRSHYVIDNLDIEGNLQELLTIFPSVSAETIATENPDNASTEIHSRINYAAVYNRSAHLTVRYCSIHDARMGVFASDDLSGAYVIEYNDIYRNGCHYGDHNIYIATDEARYPATAAIIRFNHIRNSVSGNGLKTRSAKNLVYYNVFEDNFIHSIELIGAAPGSALMRDMKVYNPDFHEFYVREDGDVVGNLVIHRDAPHIHMTLVRCGGDGVGQSYGRFRFVNNTFIMLNRQGQYRRFIRAEFGVESFEMYNNIFYSTTPDASRIFADNETVNPPRWASISGGTAIGQVGDQNWGSQWSTAWAGAAGVRVAGANNWVSAGSQQIPGAWINTQYGSNPFVDLTAGDYRVAVDAGLHSGVPVDEINTVKKWNPWKSNLYGFNVMNGKEYPIYYDINYASSAKAWFFEGETNRGITILDDGHYKGAPEMLNYEAINVSSFVVSPRTDHAAPTLGSFMPVPERNTQSK